MISNEALGFSWFLAHGHATALPDYGTAAAQAKGRERYERFVEALGRAGGQGARAWPQSKYHKKCFPTEGLSDLTR